MSGITEICFACGRPVLEDCVRGRQAEPYHRACTLAPSRAVYRAAAELDVDGSEYGSHAEAIMAGRAALNAALHGDLPDKDVLVCQIVAAFLRAIVLPWGIAQQHGDAHAERRSWRAKADAIADELEGRP